MPPPPDSTSTVLAPQARAAAQGAAQGASGAATVTPYSVTQTTLASGTVVREYVSQAGVVFGIAWNGPRMPDLSVLLGDYFPQYVDGVNALRAAHPGRGPVAVEQTGLVVRSGGHMGSFTGQAWLPQALPAGVTSGDIQ